MKRFLSPFVVAITLAASIALLSLPAPAIAQPLDKVIKTIDNRGDFYKLELNKWKTTSITNDNYFDPHFIPDKSWKSASTGYGFPKSETGTWFWTSFKIPEKIGGVQAGGSKILFRPVVLQSGDIYVNGNWVGNSYSLQGEFLITDNAVPGDEYAILIRGNNRYSNGSFLKATLLYTPQQDVDREANAYSNDLKTIQRLIEYAPDKAKWTALLEQSAAAVDLDALEKKDFSRFSISLKSARALLEPAVEFTRQFTLYALGYSHIDLAYRWDKREGVDVWVNTTRSVLKLLKDIPDWIYCAGQPAGYQYIEKMYPDMFSEIQKMVAAGRWEPVGAMWVEPDSNLPSGESFVRQLLYGKRWFREKFNKDVAVAWTPDSFGFNWNLAQIYKKAGIIGFYTMKMDWNDTTKIPYNIFWWEGPDGSRILTYLPPAGYGAALDAAPVLEHMKAIDKSADLKETFETYGVGDHGGGITRTSLHNASVFKSDPLFPKTVFTTADAYFRHLASLSKTHKFPVYKDELYLEYHRGTYTTQGATKRNNRRGEAELADAELFSSIAARFGRVYPRAQIRSAWDILLFNQFHDILPGSSINGAYKDADADYAKMLETAETVSGDAMKTIAGKVNTAGRGTPLMVFNSLAWPRGGVIGVSTDGLENKTILDEKGNALPSQIVWTPDGYKALIFASRKLPAAGYAVYRAVPSEKKKTDSGALKVTANTLENEFLKVAVNPKSGNISSLVDKRTGYEYFGGAREGNMLQCYRDKHEKYDAWNIKLHEQLPVELTSAPEIVESGPVRITLKLTKTIGKSTFVHYISLVSGIPQVFGRLDVDWRESHVMAKLAFQLNLKSDNAWYEIPYAAISRAAVAKTDADRAKWEVSAQKWVDYTGAGGKFGFSLLNNGKYGYDTKDNVMRMSLLRSPKEPDPEADMGKHSIEYAIYPHAGDWRAAQTPRRGYEFNNPALAFAVPQHGGPLPASKSFFSSEPANVILSSVKLAEDSNSLILRVYEAAGKDSKAVIKLPAKPKSVVETNLMEELPEKVGFSGDTITAPIGHYELKTFKVTF
ncbi:MAG: glycoside hydrolase family 38 C-terminal domain-containing protein [bacterium]